jgi:superfamily II DNA or RNA helicase
MSKIIVRHSSIVINNYELGDCPKLESLFSVFNRVTHDYYYLGIYYIPEQKRLLIPRGVDVHYIENLFGESAVLDTKYDPFDKLDSILIKYLPRDDRQKEALAFMLGEREYRYTKLKSQLAVNLNTGFGKTYCSIMTGAYMGVRSMIITSSISWLEQWKNFIIEYTDTKENEIYFISGSPSIHKLLRSDMSKYKFILASHATIKSYGDKYGWDKVTELFRYTKIGFKFYDEAHLNFQNMYMIDYYTNTFRTYYVTATPAKSSEEENIIYQYYFKNIPSIDLFDEENDPHTNYIGLKYNSNPNPMEISECRNQYGLDRNKYTNYIVGKDNYYKILHVLLDMAIKNGKKNLFYIGTNNAIEITKEWIVNNYPELTNEVGIFTSLTPKDEKDKQLNKRIILSTTKSCSAATDIKGLKMTVVIAEPFKSEVLARQSLGRTRDDDTYYIEVVDTGFVHINKYYEYKKPIFEKYALSCTEIRLDNNTLDNKVAAILNARLNRPVMPIEYVEFYTPYPVFFVPRKAVEFVNRDIAV